MRYAGNHKYLTYSSLILSVVSAVLGLISFPVWLYELLMTEAAETGSAVEELAESAFKKFFRTPAEVLMKFW